MSETPNDPTLADHARKADGAIDLQRQMALLKAGALQHAIVTSVNFSIIATDEKSFRMSDGMAASPSLCLRRAGVQLQDNQGLNSCT